MQFCNSNYKEKYILMEESNCIVCPCKNTTHNILQEGIQFNISTHFITIIQINSCSTNELQI